MISRRDLVRQDRRRSLKSLLAHCARDHNASLLFDTLHLWFDWRACSSHAAFKIWNINCIGIAGLRLVINWPVCEIWENLKLTEQFLTIGLFLKRQLSKSSNIFLTKILMSLIESILRRAILSMCSHYYFYFASRCENELNALHWMMWNIWMQNICLMKNYSFCSNWLKKTILSMSIAIFNGTKVG